MFKLTKIFVAGSTGYIGKNVVKYALDNGFDVVTAKRHSDNKPGQLNKKLKVIKISNNDNNWIADLEKVDVIISCLASRTGEPKDAHLVDYELNCLLLEKAKALKCSQFILLSAICVQKPRLAFQFEKLAFEEKLKKSGLNFSIVRPTAYFKSLSGQIENIKKGKPYVYFGDGQITQCNPISEKDLSLYILSCINDKTKWQKILPIGGPKQSLTPKDIGKILFEIFEVSPKYKSFPTKILDAIRLLLLIISPFSNWAKNKSELIKIAKYYATESMLIWDETKKCYDSNMTPSTGKDTLRDYFYSIRNLDLELEIDRDSKLY
ncbi:MAG: NAD-dependent epimerase/dehydratase family protein [Rhodobacterales bacterium]|nr:NAD-dependent epimerase/dehydratase family protein [Rhodobacterales bacterium]